ncbi:MAG: protein kinase domain-containing protein [Planctomycetota bacterium]|jgi:ribosomal protein L37AE/L43A
MRFTCPECQSEFESERPPDNTRLKCPACGSEFADPDATVVDETGPLAAGGVGPGKELGGFRIEEKIGTGAMGEVYRATQLSLNRTVALKVLPSVFAERPAFVKRFHDESMALSALNHPNVVTIIERGNIGSIYFFVMEHIDGPPLQEIMSGAFSVEQFLTIAKGTAAALGYAHRRGIVHRDIKPSNIMLTGEQGVKIADFGLAGLMEQERRAFGSDTQRPRRMGTPAYMSPEQKADPLDVDGRTDVYAAGVVFYELLSDQRPEVPLRQMPSELHNEADPRLDHIVARCLQESRDDRYQTAEELLEDLERFESELRRAPRCPSCGELSPVRFLRCTHCDRDLEHLFDMCPECKHRNRREVRHCLNCGVDLAKGRTLVSNRVSMMLDQADRLRLNRHFDEAMHILDEVQAVEGKAFEEERRRAEVLRDRVFAERREAARRAYEEGKRLIRERRFREAIERFKSVPQDVRDTSAAVRAAMQLQAHIAAQRKSAATVNLAFLAIGIIVVVILLVTIIILH